MGYRISAQQRVVAQYGWRKRHIAPDEDRFDIGTTPGAFMAWVDRHLQTVARIMRLIVPASATFLTLDETIDVTRRHWYSLRCLQSGMH